MSTDPWTVEKWQTVYRRYSRRGRLPVYLFIKRGMDLALTGGACLLLSPVLLAIAAAVRLTSPGTILFRQERLGRLGASFQIYKFRTMVEGAVHIGVGLNTFRGDPRVTPIGKFLREYHLDELPQLFNVLRGEMSLVGPRPVLTAALPTYNDREKRRLLMLPGITGWQQVNGGALNSLNKRIELDVWYVQHWTPMLDIRVLLKTVGVVLRKEGVYDKSGRQSGRMAERFEAE